LAAPNAGFGQCRAEISNPEVTGERNYMSTSRRKNKNDIVDGSRREHLSGNMWDYRSSQADRSNPENYMVDVASARVYAKASRS
jgi:hypothetical protein